jgi:uncharacterized protein with HEPN domain
LKRKDREYLKDILDSLNLIFEFTKGKALADFCETPMFRDAVLMRFSIIGEAVKNLSTETKDKEKDTPWREIAGLRDVVVHRYFGIDLERIWRFIQNDLPNLKSRIENLIVMGNEDK